MEMVASVVVGSDSRGAEIRRDVLVTLTWKPFDPDVGSNWVIENATFVSDGQPVPEYFVEKYREDWQVHADIRANLEARGD